MKIKPIKELRDTNEISKLCHSIDEPIYITKNGYEDLVIMSIDHFERNNKKEVVKDLSLINKTNIREQINKNGFVKVGIANIDIKVSDVIANKQQIINCIDEADGKDVGVLIFQECALTGYTCRDLFLNKSLITLCQKAVEEIIEYSQNKKLLILLGSVIEYQNKLYDTCVCIQKGKILAIIPKKHLSGIDERAFSSFNDKTKEITYLKQNVLFGNDIVLINNDDVDTKIAIELGDDVILPTSKFEQYISNGASLFINLSSNKMILEDEENKKALYKALSKKGKCAFINVSSGRGESTTDYVLNGNNIVYECGESLLNKDIMAARSLEIIDIDLEVINNNRKDDVLENKNMNIVGFDYKNNQSKIDRTYSPFPFLYLDANAKEKYLRIIKTQALGLIKRMDASYSKKLVLALSGGLDSTLALLVAVEAFKMSNRDLKDIIAITLPCFGTSVRTHDNALKLANILGVTFKEINIADSVMKHFEDIGHDPNVYNATFENAQARERTQIIMDYANEVGGMMLGTGDLSELCLGWATYNGDHMSMYGVNASIPKTLVQALTKTYGIVYKETKEVLEDIIGTPISPELLPLKDGEIAQKTEEKVGPYELIDFYIYHLLYNHFSLEKIVRIASIAFKEKYDEETIKKWLNSFIKRFYSSQFKRSCLPDGPQVSSVSVSPRNGLYMPSDASSNSLIKDNE